MVRKVNERLKGQLDKLWHTTSIYMTSPVHEYVEKITSKLPKHLSVSLTKTCCKITIESVLLMMWCFDKTICLCEGGDLD